MTDEAPTTDVSHGAFDPSMPSTLDGTSGTENLTAWLYENYSGRLRMFANRRLRDRATAEEVVQEALKTILEALRAGRVREPAAIASFAFETVRHLCMHRGRSAGREARAFERLAVAPEPEVSDALTSLIQEERRVAVRRALGQLAEEDRQILVMTYVDARESEDICRELGLSPGAVRVRRHRALKRLGAILNVTIAPNREQS